MSNEFHNIFKKKRLQITGESQEESTEEKIPVITESPKKWLTFSRPSITIILLFFSLTLNFSLLYTTREALLMFASPEHTIWKSRVSPNDGTIDEYMVRRAREKVCE